VVIATGGVDIEAASYSLRIDDEPARSVGVNASILFEDVHQGGHFIHLEGIPANCSVSGSNPATTQVTYKVLSELHIAVTCRAIPGSVRVIVTTTGTDADATGYQLSLAGPDDSRMVVLTANGDVVVAGILPGSYALSLGDVSMNCEASTANPTSTTVAKRDTVIVSIAVTCVPATQLAFMRDRRVYLVNSSGGGLKQIAQGFGQPSWSPDGTKLAVRSYGTGNEEIWLLSLDGSGAVRLTDDAARDNSPAWSPDGTRIAFVSDRSGTAQIQVMNADGTGLKALTTGSASAGEPAWSPDGSKIAYSVGGLSIYVMKSDGSGATKLATGATHPAWSPDGTQIAYAGSAAPGSSIFVMNADGSGVRRLTSGNDFGPTWSADGQWIAFVAVACGDEGCSNGLDVVRANGTRRTRIVGGPIDAPAWRP
jgi:Tol biopolymer transport system component